MHRLFLHTAAGEGQQRTGLAVGTAILTVLSLPRGLSSLPGSQQETVKCFQGF